MGKRKPALRFKGFEGEWDACSLGDIADLLTGYPFESKHFTEEGIPLVRGMNVKRGYLDMSEDICEYWSSITGLETYLLRENDIVIQMDGALIGKSYALVSKENVPSLLVQRVTRVRCPKHHFQYVYQIIQRDFLKYIKGNKTETAVPHLSLNDIKNFELALISIEEQTQIGTFFKHLDALITQQQRKYDSLLNVKKSMLEKMFPKEGADVPEIRFKGFEGKWEDRKLGEDIACIVGGGTPCTYNPTYWDGDIDWYSPTEIGDKIYANGSIKQITELGLEKSSAKMLPGNRTILFTSRAGIGDMAILQRSGTTNQGFQSLVLREGYDPYFIYSAGFLIKKYALKNSSGSTFLEISGINLGKMTLSAPKFEEQTKIGNYFKQLDALITLHHHKLNYLKHIKSALLEKMFVQEAA